LREYEEWEESDSWSSSLPELSNSDTDMIHSGNDQSGNQDHRPNMSDKMTRSQHL